MSPPEGLQWHKEGVLARKGQIALSKDSANRNWASQYLLKLIEVQTEKNK